MNKSDPDWQFDPVWPFRVVVKNYHYTRGEWHQIDCWITEQTGDTQFFNHIYTQSINSDTLALFKDANLAMLFKLRWDRGY